VAPSECESATTKSRFTEQMVTIMREATPGRSQRSAKQHGITNQTLHAWSKAL